MNRRYFALALTLATLGELSGCDDEDKGPSQKVLDALKTLNTAIDDLEGRVGDFTNNNWREVVPDVESSADDVRVAFNALHDALTCPDFPNCKVTG